MKCAVCLCSDNTKCRCTNRYISQWLDNTSIHGIVHVFKAQSPLRRILWALIFLTASGYCLYNIIERSIHYGNFPTSTAVSVEVNTSLQFPSVTVCNLNPFPKDLVERYQLTDLFQVIYRPYLKSLLALLTDPGVNTSFNARLDQLCYLYTSRLNDSTRSIDVNDILQIIEHDYRDLFIVECDFGSQLDGNCSNSITPIVTNLGLCYTFNPPANRPTRAPGTRAGLYLSLDINQASLYSTSINGNAGVKVVIHPHDILPEPDEHGISVPPGTSAFISMKTWKIIDETERNCQSTDSAPLTHFPDFQYSVSSCRANAYLNNIARNCMCVDSSAQSTAEMNGLRNCTVGDLCCAYLSTLNTTGEHCLPSCDKTQYSTTISYATYPSIDTVNTLSKTLGVNNIESDLLTINVYFEDFSITTSKTTHSYSFSSLLSDIGGQLGLFVGASVISMLEIGWLIIDLIKSVFCKKAWQQKIDTFEKELQDHVITVSDRKEEEEIKTST